MTHARKTAYEAGVLSALAVVLFVFDVSAFWFGGSGYGFPHGATAWGVMLVIVAVLSGACAAAADRVSHQGRGGILFAAGCYLAFMAIASLLTIPSAPTETTSFTQQAKSSEVNALLPYTIGWPNLVAVDLEPPAPGRPLTMKIRFRHVAKQYRSGFNNHLEHSGLVASITTG